MAKEAQKKSNKGAIPNRFFCLFFFFFSFPSLKAQNSFAPWLPVLLSQSLSCLAKHTLASLLLVWQLSALYELALDHKTDFTMFLKVMRLLTDSFREYLQPTQG